MDKIEVSQRAREAAADWAKFRLLIKDYRALRQALAPFTKGQNDD